MKQIYVVGIGPGENAKLTLEAKDILESCDAIAGYKVYVDLIREHFPDKEYIENGMRQEVKRCRLALKKADSGVTTAVVCSGDAGVYGMASIVLELSPEFPEVDVQIVPGITAALSGGAVLGAPLGHDFAVISLSDLLTPWELIEKRLRAVSAADMAICIYNPSSRKRKDYLQKACDIILENQPENLVCGYVQNIGREGQSYKLLSLRELRDEEVDMFTTVFVGNSRTKQVGMRMVTPRGYRDLES